MQLEYCVIDIHCPFSWIQDDACNFIFANTADGEIVAVGYPMDNRKIGVTLTDGAPLPFGHNYTMYIIACNVNSCVGYKGNITLSE